MSLSGLRKVSVYDPVTGTTVQMNKVGPDGTFEKVPQGQENGKGSMVYAGDESVIEFPSFDDAGFSQLETWMKDKTPVRLVTNGVEEHVLWYEDSLVSVKKNIGFKTGGRNSFMVKLTKKGGEHSIYAGANLLFAINGWIDSNSDGKADGYAFQDSPACTFTNNQQRMEFNSGNLFCQSSLVYPLSGAKLTLGTNIIDSSQGVAIKLQYNDFSAVLISADYGDSPAVKTVTSPSGTYSIQVHVARIMSPITNDYVLFGNPMLTAYRTTYKDIKY